MQKGIICSIFNKSNTFLCIKDINCFDRVRFNNLS